MLKRIMKAALAASLVFGLSSVAAAEESVVKGASFSGQVQTHWGQYNVSAPDGTYAAHFLTHAQGQLNTKASAGPLSIFMQMELRSDSKTKRTISDAGYDGTEETESTEEIGGVSKNNYNNAQLRATYKVGDLSVSAGTVSNWRSCGYTHDGQMGNTIMPTAWGICPGYTEEDGLQVVYAIVPLKGSARVTLHDTDAVSKTSVTAEVKPIDMLSVFVNQLSSTPKDAAAGTTGDARSSLLFGVKYTFGNMWVAVDSGSFDDTATKKTGADMGLQFGMKQLGPGDIVVTMGTRDRLTDGESTEKQAVTNLVYKYPVAKKATIRGFYNSKGVTPTDGDTTTTTYMGGGLELKF